ncbi:MAG: 4-hydroxy-3-methylbut-2-enyl diphosphate reductase [Candidatus Calescibacterium sp.]|nr:4-hydroxy-3-methylbut-2-enyl diphosphate reductase [Candidatus Calescibacterium sp.]MCX7734774.1 4-hydroxy-3-methylbut-2-enyl diphosphate reductase [bacterium]MDW8087365.1 4-hydroxy-3-methylbut-2-enyl diphosphate reductase [Candidatus Calescibacterium sp.]
MTLVYIGENSGFCFGVKRAIDKTLELAEKGKVKTLGYVIHNEQAVRRLKEKGVEIIENPEELDNNGAFTVIRTHGVKKDLLEKLKSSNINFFDATCPFVIRSQRIVEKFSDQGYGIIIFGDPKHPEVVGVVSYAKTENVFVVQKPEDVSNIPPIKKFLVVSQTTQKLDEFIEIVKKVIERGFEVRVFNTVCEVTVDAQKEAYEIAKLSDVVIVVGGKMSSNTDKLYKVCKGITESHKVETAEELESEWITNRNKIGVVAGTSTPDWIIKDVINKIKSIKSDKVEIVRVGQKNRYSAESILEEFGS